MAKKYTAQEMRDMAKCLHYNRPTKLTIEAAAMLCQAADAMEREEKREKKYEFAEKYSDGDISPFHDEERIDFKYTLEGSVVVRREVGAWEEAVE